MDVICVNRYYGWYEDCGHTENIDRQVVFDFTKWWQRYRRPIMITEYGADTVPGLHTVSDRQLHSVPHPAAKP